jgi:hypothetical protein
MWSNEVARTGSFGSAHDGNSYDRVSEPQSMWPNKLAIFTLQETTSIVFVVSSLPIHLPSDKSINAYGFAEATGSSASE